LSYNDLATSGLQAYLSKTDEEVQEALDQAQLYLDSRYSWPGVLVDSTQAQNWPRWASDETTLTDRNGRELTLIPQAVLDAEVAAAKIALGGSTLLPFAVASASSVAGGELIHKEVQAGSVKSVKKYSSTQTSAGGVQQFDSNGLPVIALIDAILAPIIGLNTISGSTHRRAVY